MPDYSTIDLAAVLPPVGDGGPVEDFPMYGIPRRQVLAVVAGAGGELIQAVDDDHARPEWTGYKYFVRKSKGW